MLLPRRLETLIKVQWYQEEYDQIGSSQSNKLNFSRFK